MECNHKLRATVLVSEEGSSIYGIVCDECQYVDTLFNEKEIVEMLQESIE